MPPVPSLITLLTDFGTKDYFVASMKGVILTIHPDVRIEDVSHHITPHRIDEAAYCLQACYRTFPEGTVHVVVVDPGVGSRRRPILVKTGRYYFVAPDNGVLTPVLNMEEDVEVREIENQQYRLPSPGATFHGRDVFAPAAAWLARQRPFDSFGQLIQDPVRLPLDTPFWQGSILKGKIVSIDRFGNLISNVTVHMFEEACVRRGQQIPSIHLGDVRIEGLVQSYSDGSMDKPSALINSDGQIEVFLKEKSAAAVLGVMVGEIIGLG